MVEDADSVVKEQMFARSADRASQLAPPGVPVQRGTPPGMALASEVIEVFAQPLLDEVERGDVDRVRTALLFASLVWNAIVTADGKAEDALLELSQLFLETGMAPSMLEPAAHLIHRKNRLFPDDARRFMNIEVEGLPSGELHIVAVASYTADMY